MKTIDKTLTKALLDHNNTIKNNPNIYDDYFSCLHKSIKGSALLNYLFSEGCDVNNNNWVAACGEKDHAPLSILRDYFVINRHLDEWWDHVPGKKLKYESKYYKWWFSVFDEYNLRSIDFYYPLNAIEGRKIELIIDCWGRKPIVIDWVHGAEGLTMFCLLPQIFLFTIDLALFDGYIRNTKTERILEYARSKMFQSVKSIRDTIPIEIKF